MRHLIRATDILIVLVERANTAALFSESLTGGNHAVWLDLCAICCAVSIDKY